MKNIFKAKIYAMFLIVLTCLLSTTYAQDLTFTEDEVEQWENNNREAHGGSSEVARSCYYYNICPEGISRQDLDVVFGDDFEFINKVAGTRPPDALPNLVTIKNACAKLRDFVNQGDATMYTKMRKYIARGYFATEEGCTAFLLATKRLH